MEDPSSGNNIPLWIAITLCVYWWSFMFQQLVAIVLLSKAPLLVITHLEAPPHGRFGFLHYMLPSNARYQLHLAFLACFPSAIQCHAINRRCLQFIRKSLGGVPLIEALYKLTITLEATTKVLSDNNNHNNGSNN